MIKVLIKENRINRSIRFIKGVGEKRLQIFTSLGIRTIEDAILFFPRRYEDRTKIKSISECNVDDNCTIIAKLISDVETKSHTRFKSTTKATFKDGTGTIQIIWFNSPFIKNKLKRYDTYALFGKIVKGRYGASIFNPSLIEIENIDEFVPEILPIYPLTKNVKQYQLRKMISQSLGFYENKLIESLPEQIRSKRKLRSINDSIISIHFPKTLDEHISARKRLVYEELFYLQLSLLSIKSETKISEKRRKYASNEEIYKFLGNLTFRLTDAQLRSLSEILKDLDSERIMNRLLQGDVGSGKTIVAICAALKIVLAGMQTAIMVPTSILAIQHYESFKGSLKKYDLDIVLLYSGIKGKEKNKIIEKIKSGEADIIIGTHSIIQDNIEFHKLGLVITDEQHRFGVDQRFKLIAKGNEPDKLIMTATPIPRTLGLIIYGDTDISVIDELPPDRKIVETYAVGDSKRQRIYQFIKKNVKEGKQAYIICPLIEESDLVEAESIDEYMKKIIKYLPDLKIRSLHGKMKTEEKEEILMQYKNGDIDVLVSTTVIEIGINIPNANIMLIENAERYGLAQLHQLRGRVGRGESQSYCILISDTKSELTKKRINMLVSSNDGFEISEMDLKLRGPGDFFGTIQHGLPDMKIANLYEDMDILMNVQKDIMEMKEEKIKILDSEQKIITTIINDIKEDMIHA